MPLKICLLGPVKLSKNEKPLTVRGFKPLALLAYLVLTRKAHLRQHLVDLLYTQADDPRASLRWTLNQLTKSIGKEYFITSRQSIAFNSEADCWLDIDALTNGDTAVYHGDLLAGIDIRDGRSFMDWLFFERERLRSRYQSLLELQLASAEEQTDFPAMIQIGQKLIELDNLQESWYRAVMRAYGCQGNRQAALQLYETCTALLAAELDLEPEAETEMLRQQLQSGTFPLPEHTPAATTAPPISPPPLIRMKPGKNSLPPFVARQAQLQQLEQRLSKSVSGQGQLYFIAGDAGSGKSSLATTFAQRAMTAFPDLLVGVGQCNALMGIGDPYLPFRDILGMLTGELGHWMASGVFSQAAIEQVWSGVADSVPIILGQTPALLHTVLPQRPFLDRIQRAGFEIEPTSETELAVSQQSVDALFSQTRLFQQVTHFLHTLAEKRPLLLFIDDLQWADTTSISLLFHLTKRLTYSRILLLAAYRPEEAVNNNQPLQKLLRETKRLYEGIEFNLNQLGQHENQQLVNQLLDQLETTSVSQEFRQALYQHTDGHPLFTVELIRALEPASPANANKTGQIRPSIPTWNKWPARIEAIIEERLHQLPENMRQILLVASVEGAAFTAQTVASVIGMAERELIVALTQLEKQYHFIRNQGEQIHDQRMLTTYRFSHLLFQQFIYTSISAGERRLLHGEIAEALELFYPKNDESIIIRLAHHYRQARLLDKADHYLQRAGELAVSRYANDEAILYFSQALELVSTFDNLRTFELLQARATIYEIVGNRTAQQQDLAAMREKSKQLNESYKIQALLQQANFLLFVGASEEAIQTANEAINLQVTQQNPHLLAEGYMIWGRAHLQQNQYDLAKKLIEQALQLSQDERSQREEATGLRSLGMLSEKRGEYTAARSYFNQALALHQAADYRRGQASALSNLGEIAARKGQFKLANGQFTEALALYTEMGHWQGQGEMWHKLGTVTAVAGQYKQAKFSQRKGLAIFKQIGDQNGTARCLSSLAHIHLHLNTLNRARETCHKAFQIAQESSDFTIQGKILTVMGHTLTRLNKPERAIERYQTALSLLPSKTSPQLAMPARAGLALHSIAQKKWDEADKLLSPILQFLESNTLDGTNNPFFVYQTCIQYLFSIQKDKAATLLETAHMHLQSWAALMDNDHEKQLFLNATGGRQQIVSWYTQTRENN